MISRKIYSSAQYLLYRLRAVSQFKVHSPFVYKIYTEVILKKSEGSQRQIEKQRNWLLRQKSLMETTDFGAGAGKGDYKTRFRQVRNITKHSSASPKFGKLLYRLVAFFEPDTILEIGTAMGISTMYMAKAAPHCKIISMEGCAVIAASAKDNFNKLNIQNIELTMGNFNQLLGKTIKKIDRIDFALIDGNHRKEPTIKYFEEILDKLHPGSVVVLDDIHWSKGMQEAWKIIKANEKVSISIDLFSSGILFFKDDIAKEDHILKF